MAATLAFWAVSLLIAAFSLPIAFVLMRRLSGAGAGLAFSLGLVLVGYLYFIFWFSGVLSPVWQRRSPRGTVASSPLFVSPGRALYSQPPSSPSPSSATYSSAPISPR